MFDRKEIWIWEDGKSKTMNRFYRFAGKLNFLVQGLGNNGKKKDWVWQPIVGYWAGAYQNLGRNVNRLDLWPYFFFDF
jgi:hypothetical protein